MSKRPKRRWSDNDRHFGPFTFARSRAKRFGFVLDSGDEDHPGCHVRVHVAGGTAILELPPILRPHRRKVKADTWDTATIARLGRDWYYDEHARELGAVLVDGAVHFHYGRQTHDSRTQRSKCWFVPWLNWRHVRHSLYGLDGEHLYTKPKGQKFHEWYAIEKACPSAHFEFRDYDGEYNTAATHIDEMEWRFGTGWFKWLSLFRPAKVQRSLDIDFSKETGPKKGSWKGGTVGHSIQMKRGELHAAAFQRYCAKHNMTYIGPTITTPSTIGMKRMR